MKQAQFICNPSEIPVLYDRNIRFSHREVGYSTLAKTILPREGLTVFRRDFSLAAGTAKVVLRATALGVFQLYLNGARIEGEEMKPGWTDYNCRVFEFEYDVTARCAAKNTLLIVVAGGWFNGRIARGGYGNQRLSAAAEIECLDTAGGTLSLDASNDTWLTTIGGQVRMSDIYDGEYIDATLPDLAHDPDAYQWQNAIFFGASVPAITPQIGAPVRVRPQFDRRPVTAVRWRDTRDNGTDYGEIVPLEKKAGENCERQTVHAGEQLILDLEQNMVGRPRVTLRAARGTRVELFVAEMPNDSGALSRGNDGPAGSLYIANYRTARARMVYIAAGEGEETAEPLYTFYGFRYFGIIADGDVEIVSVTGVCLGSDLAETGFVETSNAEVNRLISNIFWGQRSNYFSVPTDCPQRDERLGWTGDTQIFCGAGTYNADARLFLKKWLTDMRDGQNYTRVRGYPNVVPSPHGFTTEDAVASTGWSDAGVIVPWVLYQKYGDVETVAEHYDSMESYMAGLADFGLHGPREKYGDWLSYEETPKAYLSLCYYALDADLMTRFSAILGKEDRRAHYAALRERIQQQFEKEYMRDGKLTVTTQTSYLLALRFDLLRGDARKAGIAALAEKIKANDYTLSTGFLGTGVLNQTLSEVGLDDLAYSLLLQTRDPSWLYSVRQGATTVWERWNSYTKETGFGKVSMNSFNHYAYGAVAEWLYAFAAGIRPDPEAPGFAGKCILAPRPDRRKTLPDGQQPITWLRAHYDSYGGRIESAWEKTENGFTYRFAVPAGMTAAVSLPLAGDTLTVNGKETTLAALGGHREGAFAAFTLSAGKFEICANA